MIRSIVLAVGENQGTDALLTFLLGGGAVGAIGALFKGLSTIRTGTRAREREAINDLGEWREQEHEARLLAEKDADYWRRWCNHYIGQLLRNNIDPIPAPDTLESPSSKSRRELNHGRSTKRAR